MRLRWIRSQLTNPQSKKYLREAAVLSTTWRRKIAVLRGTIPNSWMRDGRPRVSSRRRLAASAGLDAFRKRPFVTRLVRHVVHLFRLDSLHYFLLVMIYSFDFEVVDSAVVPQFWILVWVSLSLTRMILMILSMIKPNLPAVGSMSSRFYPANLPMNLSIKGYWFENEVPMNPQNWHFGWSYTIHFCGSLIFTQTHIMIFRWLE